MLGGTIDGIKRLSEAYLLLTIKSSVKLTGIKSGQFINLEIPNHKQVYLRRPFSIHDVDLKKNTLSLLIKIIGKGTNALADLKIGQSVSMVGPLGNGFELIKKGNALLIGGGCGVAPLLLLAKQLSAKKIKTTIILGGRSKQDIVQLEAFNKQGDVFITTEDGTCGKKGFVTAALQDLKKYEVIYTCGPEAMLRGIYKLAQENKIALQVSMENMMACGFGVCLCCVTKTKKGHTCVCTDGPVFQAEQLTW